MPQYRSIESIWDETRRRADRPSTLRPTDDDGYSMLRESWRSLHSMLTARADQSRDFSTATVSVVSGTRSYDLPTSAWKIIGVKVADSSTVDGFRVMERFSFDDRHNSPLATDSQTSRYEIRGGQIWFSPTPNWSGTVTLEFIPFASWTPISVASAPTTASTQATGTGATTWRVNVAAVSVAVGKSTASIAAAADFSVHSSTQLVTNGQSCRATLVAKNVSGTVSVVAVKGTAATTGAELAPTKAQIQAAVGAGNIWTRLSDIRISRTADTTVTQTQDSVDYLDAANGLDEWLVCDVASKLKAIDEEDASYFIGQRESIGRRLLSESTVDVAKPMQVANTRRRQYQRWA
jgi:hypothetical protein